MNSEISSIIETCLKDCMDDIFDSRNDNINEEGIRFLQVLKPMTNCTNEEISTIIETTLTHTDEILDEIDCEDYIRINQLANMKDNIGEESPISIRNRPLSDVEVFTTLYDNGYIKDSYMQKHIAGHINSVESMLSDIFGRQLRYDAFDTVNPQVQLNDCIDSDYILSEAKKFINDDNHSIDASKLIKSLKFRTINLAKSIADGRYEDMSVNALLCHIFSALVAMVARLECSEKTNTKIKNTINDIMDFISKFGRNDFFVCAGISLALAFVSQERGTMEDVITFSKKITKQLINLFDGNYVTLPNKDIFPYELSSLLGRLGRDYDCKLTEEDRFALGLPLPILMTKNACSENNDDRQKNGMTLKESVKIGQGPTETQVMIDTDNVKEAMMHSSSYLDSLVERLQVESGRETGSDKWSNMTFPEIHNAIMENQDRLFHNALRHDIDALKSNLATNVVILEELQPLISNESDCKFSPGELNVLRVDNDRMYHNNKKYIDIVEGCSFEAVQQYADENSDKILLDMSEK